MSKINAFDFLMKETRASAKPGDSPSHKLMFDGGSRGNPGICGCGYVIYEGGERVLLTGHKVVSNHNTSNFAEYMALILGLQEAIEKGIEELYVEGDSMLVIKQVRNEWAVKSPNLIPLYKEVKELCNSFTNIKFEHVKRENNKTADALVNKALDEIGA
jgi:ribonuclease HI